MDYTMSFGLIKDHLYMMTVDKIQVPKYLSWVS